MKPMPFITTPRLQLLYALMAAAHLVMVPDRAVAADCATYAAMPEAQKPRECQAPVMTSPRSTYDSGARVPDYQRRSDSVINIQASPAIIPPRPCPASTLSWTVSGVACSGSAVGSNDGGIVPVQDSAQPNTGTATYICSNGAYIERAGSSCNPPAAPPASCPSGVDLTWTNAGNTCNGPSSSAPSGTNIPVTDSTGATTGAATFVCNNGAFSYLSGSCSAAPPASCATAPVSWTVAGSTCNGTLVSTANGGTATVSDGTAPTTGSAAFICDNGTFAQTTAQQAANTCSVAAPPPPPSCPSTTVNWAVGSNSCSATAAATAAGSSVPVTDATAPTTGSATFVCNSGSFALQSGSETCTTAPPPPCAIAAGQSYNWGTVSPQCTYTFPSATSVPSGGTLAISDATAPSTGTATLSCGSGSIAVTSPSCAATPPPADCAASTANWSTANGSCSSSLAATLNGASRTVSSTNGTTGSATYTCNSTVFALNPGATCGPPPPAVCGTQNFAALNIEPRTGNDFFTSAGRMEAICGATGNPSVRYALGNAFETNYGIDYAQGPSPTPVIAQVPAANMVTPALSTSEPSLRLLGKSRLDTSAQWNLNGMPGEPTGTHYLYVVNGSCTGSSCQYNFYRSNPARWYHPATTTTRPLGRAGQEMTPASSDAWLTDLNGGGFKQLCASGSFSSVEYANAANVWFRSAGKVNHVSVPPAVACYRNQGNAPNVRTKQLTLQGLRCPSGTTENTRTNRCESCNTGDLVVPANRVPENGSANGNLFVCYPAAANSVSSLDSQNLTRFTFSR